VNLKERLSSDEVKLQAIMRRLNAVPRDEPSTRRAREKTLHELSTVLVETRCFVDECLSGCTERDRNALTYKIRVEYPLFSLLDSLACLSGEFVDWSVRDFSLTAAAAR
jgi:hypothetical protein